MFNGFKTVIHTFLCNSSQCKIKLCIGKIISVVGVVANLYIKFALKLGLILFHILL